MSDPIIMILVAVAAFAWGAVLTLGALWFFVGRKDEDEYAAWHRDQASRFDETKPLVNE